MAAEIYDCFTFFNESDILRLRLNELGPHVDHFVIVEATETFTGKRKPLYMNTVEKADWYQEHKEKVIRVVVDFPSKDMTSWDREIYQRNQITRGLEKAKSSNDIVIISDVDEIPRPGMFHWKESVQLDVTQYFWNFHWEVPVHCNQGARPVVTRVSHLYLTTPQEMRASVLPRIQYGGWHFSFFGGVAATIQKIEAFAHTEVDKPEFKSPRNMTDGEKYGIDPFNRFPLKYSEINETYPKWVQDNEGSGILGL